MITLVADGQDPEVRKLLRDLRLKAAIEAPRLDRLTTAGHRMGHARGAVARADRRDRGRPRADGPNKTEGRSIFVGNLPWKTTSGDLEELFAEYGTVVRASISIQAKSGRSKGFGFVDIVEHRADAAIDALNGAMMGGRPLRIRPAR